MIVLLHGFPQDRQSWAAVADELRRAGEEVLIPELPGYCEGPNPRRRRDYTLDALAAVVIDQVGDERFDLVGHDLGALLAFHIAGLHPERVRTLTAFSVPHRGAWSRPGLEQLRRSAYIGLFQLPLLPELLLTPRLLERQLRRSGLDPDSARRYARAKNRKALHWYRALPLQRRQSPRISVPTLFVWSDGDEYITEGLARRCAAWVDGEYTFRILRGVNHWIPELHPRLAAELILSRCR
ncbi:alpha/beta hydrolase [Dactylosporangium vinaceum]|uniref:Alpha/beta fold hydrolase n=1 Tax=Dactylosporangium vinaceum TaxID=53362 RepID=A0ABV5MPK1_9ACTN|nr:alpha/beta hydrolase [Dactylosporangium vinaceum]UAB96745.1 alpha/beta hydrolase [Dactylosporangium vinaceum]